MVKPTTVPKEEYKDPIDKVKEELKGKDETAVVITAGPPTPVRRSKRRCKVFALLGIAVVLLLLFAFVRFAVFGCGVYDDDEEHTESEEHNEHSDTFEIKVSWDGRKHMDDPDWYPSGGEHHDSDRGMGRDRTDGRDGPRHGEHHGVERGRGGDGTDERDGPRDGGWQPGRPEPPPVVSR